MRERWSMVLLGVGLFLALLAGVVVYTTTARGGGGGAANVPRVSVVVAKADIPQLTVVTADMVELRSRPEDAIPARALTAVEQAVGRTVVDAVREGAAVTSRDLVEARGQSGVSLTLASGQVLMVFPMTDPLTSSKVLRAGDRIDIQATLPNESGVGRVTQTIVQNLEVVSVAGERPVLVTFVVERQVSLVLKHLRDIQAQLDIVVRAATDTQQIRTDAVDLPYLVERYGIRATGGQR